MKLMQCLATSSLVLLLGACSSSLAGSYDLSHQEPPPGQDFAISTYDFAQQRDDLAFPQPDFGQGGDFGHHHHHDFGFPGEDLAFPVNDFAQQGVDLSQQHVDFAQPPGVDLLAAAGGGLRHAPRSRRHHRRVRDLPPGELQAAT